MICAKRSGPVTAARYSLSFRTFRNTLPATTMMTLATIRRSEPRRATCTAPDRLSRPISRKSKRGADDAGTVAGRPSCPHPPTGRPTHSPIPRTPHVAADNALIRPIATMPRRPSHQVAPAHRRCVFRDGQHSRPPGGPPGRPALWIGARPVRPHAGPPTPTACPPAEAWPSAASPAAAAPSSGQR